MNDNGNSAPSDRVRRHTASEINRSIDQKTEENLRAYCSLSANEISERIEELNNEWDIERWLETNASTLALTGLVLGVTVDKKWLIIPGVVLPFLFQHAVQGWCPPLPILRRLGIRTRKEIDAEKYALKAMRGDFSGLPSEHKDVRATLKAVRLL